MQVECNGNHLELMVGDITKQETDAIVNAANGTLLGGGGVDGAIHQAAGKDLLVECKKVRAETLHGEDLPTGEAVITKGYNLPASFVIHTAGPVWNNKGDEESLLVSSYNNCLVLAFEKGVKSISFPSISTGVYRFPVKIASKVALKTIVDFLQNHHFGRVVMTLYSEKDYETYASALKTIKVK